MRTSIIQVPHPTTQRLLDAGLAMLLEHGYNDLGIQALLAATATPKGSFYQRLLAGAGSAGTSDASVSRREALTRLA